MNYQRRRQLADAADQLDTINQLLPIAVKTIQAVLQAEADYVSSIPKPLTGSLKAVEANRIVKELGQALKQLQGVDLTPVSNALDVALAPQKAPADFGSAREGVLDLETAAQHALAELKGPSKGRRRAVVVRELEQALQH
jgi:hypothetical protein